jgi:hypothetical protein
MFWVRKFVYTAIGFVVLAVAAFVLVRAISEPIASDDELPLNRPVGESRESFVSVLDRDRLVICVDTIDIDASHREAARDQLQMVVAALASEQNEDASWVWDRFFGPGAMQWQVMIGCSDPQQPGFEVFVASPEYIGGRSNRSLTHSECGGDSCSEYVTGIEVSDSEICDQFRMREALRSELLLVYNHGSGDYSFDEYDGPPVFISDRTPTPTPVPSSLTLPC